MQRYQELLSYQGKEMYTRKFESFFQPDAYLGLASLRDIVQQQRDFVRSRFSPSAPALYQTQQQFVSACDKLLNALTQSTLEQWCYSHMDDRFYHGNIPTHKDCLGAINTSWTQYQELED